MLASQPESQRNQTETRLLILAAVFLALTAVAISLAPAVRIRSLQFSPAWQHWLAYLAWLVMFFTAQRQCLRRLKGRDPYLLPAAGLLIGWGLLTITQLLPGFGLRQTIWMVIAMAIFIAGLRLPPDFKFLRRFKYLWLSAGLALTGLTLFLGTNPLGYGPEMWLGCCGIYLQPSEPLKLLLIIYLSAYLAEQWISPARGEITGKFAPLLPILGPTLIMTGLAISLLLLQRDLGTASIILLIYAAIIYIASGRLRVMAMAALVISLGAVAGYVLFEVVRIRMDGWLNPWIDPSGRSFQIVQSLIAIANGGVFGRGPGLGNPELVPVSHSDFIFSTLTEGSGLLGGIGLIALLALFAIRGLGVAISAPDAFRRYLAGGLTVYLTAQSILIIGGNIRLLPLTGVTLPFVSYGGSSLVVSVLSLLLLLIISATPAERRLDLTASRPILSIAAFLLTALAAAAAVLGWWAVARGPDLLTRTDNQRRSISDRYIRRGSIVDRNNRIINSSEGQPGSYIRQTDYPNLSSIVGYTDPIYGQAGLEASLDTTLRGLAGNPAWLIWLEHLLYGQPPPGLDVRTSLDLELQKAADQLLGDEPGALVLVDAGNGEILAMASHPTFNANRLTELGELLIKDPGLPLVNRAILGYYPVGSAFSKLSMIPTLDPGEGYSNPLSMALKAAALSAGGQEPAPRLATALSQPQGEWQPWPIEQEAIQPSFKTDPDTTLLNLTVPGQLIWQAIVPEEDKLHHLTWFLGGTLPNWSGRPLALAVLLEADKPTLAAEIGQKMLKAAMGNK